MVCAPTQAYTSTHSYTRTHRGVSVCGGSSVSES
jgi:hypothetical protein